MMLCSAPMTFCSWPAKVCTMYQRPGRSKALSATGSSKSSSRMVISRISSLTVSSSVVGVSISLMIALLLEEERDELGEAVAKSEDEGGHEDQDAKDDDRVVDDLGTSRPGYLAHLFT